MRSQWFVIHTLSGQEQKVKESIEKRIKPEEMGEYIWKNHEKLLLELSLEERRSVIASLEALRVGMEAVKEDLA